MSCVHTCARVCLCLHERAGGAGGAAWGACCTCGRCSMGSVGLVFEPKAKGCGVCLVCALVRECACACVLRQVEPAVLLVALAAPAAAALWALWARCLNQQQKVAECVLCAHLCESVLVRVCCGRWSRRRCLWRLLHLRPLWAARAPRAPRRVWTTLGCVAVCAHLVA